MRHSGGVRAITVSDAENSRVLLQQEINLHQDARHDHRLHCVSLVATGIPCGQVARVFGAPPRSAASWVRGFDTQYLQKHYQIHVGGRQCQR